jgi:hypothetical protein
MYTNSTAMKLWTTMVEANVDLYNARMAFSAEMFDLYTQWPRRSFGEAVAVVKSTSADAAAVKAVKKTVTKKAKAPTSRKPATPKTAAKRAVTRKPAAKNPAAKTAATATKTTATIASKPDVAKPVKEAASKPVTLPNVPENIVKERPVEPIVDLNEPGKAVPQK